MIPIVAAIFSVLLSVSTPASVQSDQWNVMTVSEGQYFTVKAFEGIDTSELLRKLNYNSFSQVETFLMDGQALSKPEDLVGRDLDAIYLEVQNILGLEIPSFHGTVVICPDELAVHEEFQKIYGMDFNERSFYVFDSNTVFISYSDLTLGMLGHEIAHAVISGYFVVPPPTKVQEVLAGYVEYSLRKMTANANQ